MKTRGGKASKRNHLSINRPVAHPLVEALEPRRMLAAVGSVTLHDGALVVRGTSADDQISIGSSWPDSGRRSYVTVFIGPRDVTVGSPQPPTVASFRCYLSSVRSIRAYGGEGRDSIDVSGMERVPSLRAINIYGNEGNDNFSCHGSQMPSLAYPFVVHGGAGDDTLWANGYVSAMFGDAGRDRLVGSYVSGGVIDGGLGDDTLFAGGGDHPESLYGGEGDDKLALGGADIESLLIPSADSGHDERLTQPVLLDGGLGDDTVIGNMRPKADERVVTLLGGAGSDEICAFGNENVGDAQPEDMLLGDDRFTGTPAVDQTATLEVRTGTIDTTDHIPLTSPVVLRVGLGDHGPGSAMVIADDQGTLRMHGPAGSVFTLGRFFNDIGIARRGVPSILPPFYGPHVTATVNGIVISNYWDFPTYWDYPIQNGDHVVLSFLHSIAWS